MQRSYLVTLACLIMLSACDREQASSSTQQTQSSPAVSNTEAVESTVSETDLINEWFEARFEEELAFSPIWQSVLGRKTDYRAGDHL